MQARCKPFHVPSSAPVSDVSLHPHPPHSLCFPFPTCGTPRTRAFQTAVRADGPGILSPCRLGRTSWRRVRLCPSTQFRGDGNAAGPQTGLGAAAGETVVALPSLLFPSRMWLSSLCHSRAGVACFVTGLPCRGAAWLSSSQGRKRQTKAQEIGRSKAGWCLLVASSVFPDLSPGLNRLHVHQRSLIGFPLK